VALYLVPPTVARFRAMAPKPEVFAGFSDEVIALFLERHADTLQSALGDRATLPIVQWDAACDGAVIAATARSVLNSRGRNRQAGVDDSIDADADEALAFFDRCRPGKGGADGKRENPRFLDSKQNRPQDAVIVLSSATSDAWTKRRRRRCC
jgi:hypothetical protein